MTPKINAAPEQVPRRPRLLYFYSPTDGASRKCDAFLAHALQRNANHETFEVLRIDVTKRPDLAERFRIEELPTILVVADRKIRTRIERPTNVKVIQHDLAAWLRG